MTSIVPPSIPIKLSNFFLRIYKFSSSTTVPEPAPLPPKSGVLSKSLRVIEFFFTI
jgi:hypothetical protein